MDKQQITTWIEAAQQVALDQTRDANERDILLRDGAEMMAAALAHIEALEAELEALRDALVWITSLPLSQIQAIRCATH